MNLNLSTYTDAVNYGADKKIKSEHFCDKCGLEVGKDGFWGMCKEHYEEAIGNDPAHPSEWMEV
ncbi:MAG: hypothetical protein ACTSQE_07460 [Candidatus Heimdallarchaeaceae archaeon]